MHVATGAVLQEMVFQIVSYPNLTSLFIESFSCSYHLYNDMVPFTILQYLGSCTKPKLDYKGIGISPWLNNLSVFTGEFFRTYYKTELTGILSSIADSLSIGQVAEICILKQILSRMSGWNPPEKLTEKMLSSLAGGPKLKIAAYELGENRIRTTKSSAALCIALQQKVPERALNFSMELAILAGQQAQVLLYSETGFCKEQTNYKFSEIGNFKILCLLYDHLISTIILLIDILSLLHNKAESYAELLPPQPIVVLSTQYKLPLPLVMYIVRPGIDVSKFDTIIEQLNTITPDTKIPITFFAIFWALSLADIRSAEPQYNSEINMLKQNPAKNGTKTQEMIEQLSTELSFLKYRQGFFADFIKKHTQIPKDCNLATELVQKGIYPRLLCSPSDALYCAYFIETIMKLRIPDFPVLELIHQCIILILPCLHCCTEGEAENIGFFLLELLKIISSWKNSMETDGKNCIILKEASIKDLRETFAQYHNLVASIITGGLSSSYLVQKNFLIVINRVSSEFPSTKESATKLMECILPIKESDMEGLRLIAQRVYDNIEKKFTEVVAPVELPKKRSHDKSEERKPTVAPYDSKKKTVPVRSSRHNESDAKYYSERRSIRKDDHRHSYVRRN